MRAMNKNNLAVRLVVASAILTTSLFAAKADAAVPGITGPTFNLDAKAAYITQPDGASLYAWGYGCASAPAGFMPAGVSGAGCPDMQLPGPTLIVHEGDTVMVTL